MNNILNAKAEWEKCIQLITHVIVALGHQPSQPSHEVLESLESIQFKFEGLLLMADPENQYASDTLTTGRLTIQREKACIANDPESFEDVMRNITDMLSLMQARNIF
ncbi:hypothetical protein N7494_006660 [Penicillium frequentans]|uniref:Uncharacterized protein n=1 Tax=Penicillium frequentans TaxID=3151616 RepID=A0AAD6CWS7_9EURO|nr:hypothetical protein N7494_006660 [Penicillium glabrum]